MIDELGFDQSFLSRLSLITSVLTLAGLFLFRRFMAEKSIAQIVIFLTLATTLLSLPIIGMFHGLHEWTAATPAASSMRASSPSPTPRSSPRSARCPWCRCWPGSPTRRRRT
jgi:hypothetical protein